MKKPTLSAGFFIALYFKIFGRQDGDMEKCVATPRLIDKTVSICVFSCRRAFGAFQKRLIDSSLKCYVPKARPYGRAFLMLISSKLIALRHVPAFYLKASIILFVSESEYIISW